MKRVWPPSVRGAAAAALEGSKSHCKEFLLDNGIPTADAAAFDDAAAALEHLEGMAAVPVVKATGLAAGKGVIVAETTAEAADAITSMLLEDRFGEAGHEILLEERLVGTEVSVLAFCDGRGLPGHAPRPGPQASTGRRPWAQHRRKWERSILRR